MSHLAGVCPGMSLGTAAIILPWHDPLRVAENAAVVDMLCKGKLRLGLGRGLARREFAAFRLSMDESRGRFDEALILLGILPDQPNAHSIVTVQIRDPQGDMTEGHRPKARRSELPLTRPAAAAVAGTTGIDMVGYRDYRGVVSVGAWKWLPKYDIGIITEVDVGEAFRPLTILQWTFGAPPLEEPHELLSKGFVGLRHGLELLLGFGIVAVDVRVELASEAPKRLLDLGLVTHHRPPAGRSKVSPNDCESSCQTRTCLLIRPFSERFLVPLKRRVPPTGMV
jgi:hypothetical protein